MWQFLSGVQESSVCIMPSHNTTKISKFSRGSMPMDPLAVLRGNDLQDSVLHESVEKAGIISCNIRLCSEILCIRRFYLLNKNTKKTRQMRPNRSKISKFSRGSMPPENPSKASRLPCSPSHLPCSKIVEPI